MRVKICGITNVADAGIVADNGADFVGLILAKSPRQVSLESAREIMGQLPGHTQPVLLFRDAPIDEVITNLRDSGCGWVQLHGNESADDVARLASALPHVRIIKAWSVTAHSDAGPLRTYLDHTLAAGGRIDVVLLDAPKGGPHPGYATLGEISRGCVERPPEVWCAGGLTPDNVADAVACGTYDGVDVASGVEQSPGTKDHAAVARFISTGRAI